MSLACRECGQSGAFSISILFQPDGHFDYSKKPSSYENFFTCDRCAPFDDFRSTSESEFMVIERPVASGGTFVDCAEESVIRLTKHKMVSEDDLRRALPKTCAALKRSAINPSLKIARDDYWDQFERMHLSRKCSGEFATLLRKLITAHLRKSTMPDATPELVSEAKALLKNGILIMDPTGEKPDEFLELVVYIPLTGQEENRRTFFSLIKKYAGVEIRRLEELP